MFSVCPGALGTFVAMMHRTLIAILLGLCGSNAVWSQTTWRRTYGSFGQDEGACIRVTPEGDYVVAGSTGSFGAGSSDLYLLKLDGDGVPIWTKTIGGAQIDRGTSMCVASDGSILVAGYSNGLGFGSYDGWLVKTDPDGEVLWQRTYGGTGWDFLYDIEPVDDGGWLLSGATYSAGNGGSDGWLLRTDADGAEVWNMTFGGEEEDELRSAKQTNDAGFILAGTVAVGDTSDAWVIRLDQDAEVVWDRRFGGDSAEWAMDVIETLDGGFSVVGSTRSYSVWTEHLHFKLSAIGDSLWFWHYGQINDQEAMDHLEVASGRFATIGYTKTTGGGGEDLFALLSEQDGSFVVGHTYGWEEDDIGYSIAETEGGFVLCGTTSAPTAGGMDVFVSRVDSVLDTATETVITYFDVTAVASANEWEQPGLLFPNPATTSTRLTTRTRLTTATLFDTQGRLVRTWPAPVPQELDLRGLAEGTYRLVAIGDDGGRMAQPLVIAGN